MLSVAEAAAHATVSEGLIRRWLKEGLPHYRLGAGGRRGKIAIRVEELDGWLAAFKVEKRPSVPSPVPAKSRFKHLRLG